MQISRALSVASWLYFGEALLFLAAAIVLQASGAPGLTGLRFVSFSVVVAALIGLGLWTRLVVSGRVLFGAKLFFSSLLSVTVLGVFFGNGLLLPFLFGIPSFFVVLAWDKVRREAKESHDG
jgi:hypothetical protein